MIAKSNWELDIRSFMKELIELINKAMKNENSQFGGQDDGF